MSTHILTFRVAGLTFLLSMVSAGLAAVGIKQFGFVSNAASLVGVVLVVVAVRQDRRFWNAEFARRGIPIANERTQVPGDPYTPLSDFRWFIPRATREDIELAMADLAKDAREMRADGKRRWFVVVTHWWKSVVTIAPIVGSGVLGIATWIRSLLTGFRPGPPMAG